MRDQEADKYLREQRFRNAERERLIREKEVELQRLNERAKWKEDKLK